MGLMASSENGVVKWVHDSTHGWRRFEKCYNPSGSSMTANAPIAEKAASVTYHGLELIEPATGNLDRMKGVVDETLLTLTWGWVQTFGYRSAMRVESTTDIAAGDSLKMVNAQTYMVKDTAAGTPPTYVPHVIAKAARTDNDVGTIAVVIKCNGGGPS